MNIKIIMQYIKTHIITLIMFFVFALIFLVTFFLYGYALADFFYAALLCIVLGAIAAVISYFYYRKKYLLLQDTKESITFDISNLPKSDNAIEEKHIELINALFKEKDRIETSAGNSRTELLDYYTMWAHQIKVPLAALKLLIESDENNKTKQLNELFKVEQYVDMVLGYLRMESMSADLLLKNYSLDKIVKQAVRKYSILFIQKKIRLELTELTCDVLTDEKWLMFVVEQILSNAIKYTKEGGIISIYKEEPKTLVIKDNGIGIDKEDINRVFQRGFTGYNGREHKKSTGIGLYLCKRIINKLSHTITIESEIGTGTKVLLDLSSIDVFIE